VQEQILQLMATKSTAVMTNVPGPQKPLYLAGREIREQMFWVPQSGNIGMGVSILSYNGAVQFGVITDAKLVPDPEHLIEEFQAELEKLVLAVLMEPFDEKRPPSLVERALARATARWQRLREVTAPARPPALPAPAPDTKGEHAAKPSRKARKTARRAPARRASSPARVR
jgi:hypothetical protein